eukprot:CAMPEP_0117083640 /NCGR_PEP_ID=MMETSP0472-20121206/58883_1 /TAXON_ID=693140 ORGANISM="Tiarina fusus, Strain LIS" /NCGR_SAMPLE_ID=MMETSP0472 /ASSEMBLY_ACC=CAM_ASM_000603 /LENGTH=579 /DNA_ID=CAMNT_0004812337 /DNA_START=121 /DNA_END=1861 /DNA_ORIENTATION=+
MGNNLNSPNSLNNNVNLKGAAQKEEKAAFNMDINKDDNDNDDNNSSSPTNKKSRTEDDAVVTTAAATDETSMSGLSAKFERALRIIAETDRRVPTEDLTQEELDALFAHDMYSMSLEERAKVLHDMHGVPEVMDETPAFVTEQRSQLFHEIDLLLASPAQDTDAYQQALDQDQEFVTGSRTQLAFLRSESFDPKATALRLVIGPTKLTRDITIKDMAKEDKKSLESGFFQLLQVRDAASRAVMMGVPCLGNYKDAENFKRSFYYMVMTAMHDVSTQINGLIFIGYNMGKYRKVDRTAAWCVSQMRKVLPMRIVGMHYCYDDFRMRAMMTVAMLVMGGTNRVRFRGHYGDLEENLYKLQTFGLPTEALPVTADGEPKNKSHRQWLKTRSKQESDPQFRSDLFIVVPNRLDVLFGRGKPIQEHFGNIRYHSLLDYYQNAYERSKKFEKMQISQRVVDTVHAFVGRFLKQEGSGWVEVDDLVARDKVSHAFRTRRANHSSSSSTPSEPTTTTKSSATMRLLTPSSSLSSNREVTVCRTVDPSTVTDTENDHDSSSCTEDECDSIGGKRARLWESTFHEIETT